MGVDIISPISLEDIPESDAAVSYYVSGYIGLQISNRKKCMACKDLLLASCDPIHIADFVAQEDKNYLILLIEVVSQNLVNFIMWLLLLQLFIFLL